jgi:outer membrane lipase/esterase
MRLRTILLLTAVSAAPCSAIFAAPISASQVTQIVSFGDSLSDPGNADIGSGGVFPGSGYATRTVPVYGSVGYYTNPQFAGGPSGLWVDQLAAKLGVPDPLPFLSAPFSSGGTNYAVGSALTGTTNPQDMGDQLGAFITANGAVAPSTALYTFWGGANDILAAQSPITAADNIEAEIAAVASAGGKNFLWLDLPNLGDLPELAADPAAQAAATLATDAFNAEWATDVATLDGFGINVIGVDVGGLFTDIVNNPSNYGLNNVTTACAITSGCNPNTALFWDGEHPTTEGHALVADLAYNDAFAPVPEPSTLALVGTSALGLAGALRRKLSRNSRA